MLKIKCKTCGKLISKKKAVEDLKTHELYCSVQCLTKDNPEMR